VSSLKIGSFGCPRVQLEALQNFQNSVFFATLSRNSTLVPDFSKNEDIFHHQRSRLRRQFDVFRYFTVFPEFTKSLTSNGNCCLLLNVVFQFCLYVCLVFFLSLWLCDFVVAQQSIRLGGLFPLTGRLGQSGPQRQSAAKFAVEYINKNRTDLLPNVTLTLLTNDTGSFLMSFFH
jgi:hypothetical protein